MSAQLHRPKKQANDAVAGMGVPTCKTCAHLQVRKYRSDCAITGFSPDDTRLYREFCGPQARYWTPKPPTFWQRLGEAIVARVRGKS